MWKEAIVMAAVSLSLSAPWELFIEKQDLLGRVLYALSISVLPSLAFCEALGPCECPDLRDAALSNKLGNTIHCT